MNLETVLYEVKENIAQITMNRPDKRNALNRQMLEDLDAAYKHWQSSKEKEKNYKDRKSILDGVPKTLPALIKAQKVSKRAAHRGFDWPDVKFVIDKCMKSLKK